VAPLSGLRDLGIYLIRARKRWNIGFAGQGHKAPDRAGARKNLMALSGEGCQKYTLGKVTPEICGQAAGGGLWCPAVEDGLDTAGAGVRTQPRLLEAARADRRFMSTKPHPRCRGRFGPDCEWQHRDLGRHPITICGPVGQDCRLDHEIGLGFEPAGEKSRGGV